KRRLVFPWQVGKLRAADVAARDLFDRGGRVDDLVGGDAGNRTRDDHARAVPAGLLGLQPDRLEALPDDRDVFDADPVELNVLPVGDVGGVAGVCRRDLPDGAELLGGELPAVDPDAQHEV